MKKFVWLEQLNRVRSAARLKFVRRCRMKQVAGILDVNTSSILLKKKNVSWLELRKLFFHL